MEITLYRGMNEKEYELWNNSPHQLNNVSWWSSNITTAKMYAHFAIAKCIVNLEEEHKKPFQNGALKEMINYFMDMDNIEKRKISFV